MRHFLPNNFLEMPDAIAQACDRWSDGAYTASALDERQCGVLVDYYRANAKLREALRVASQPPLSGLAALGAGLNETPVLTDDLLRAAERTEEIADLMEAEDARAKMLTDAWDALRQSLYAGDVLGYVYFPKTGKTEPCPEHFWGQVGLTPSTGAMTIRIGDDVSGWRVGLARIRQEDLERYIDGGDDAAKRSEGEASADTPARKKRGAPELDRAKAALTKRYPDGLPSVAFPYTKALAEINDGLPAVQHVKEATLKRAVSQMRMANSGSNKPK